jgi:hypothetical protein
MHLLRQISAISYNTFFSIIRQPLVLLLATLSMLVMAVVPVVIMFDLGEGSKLIRDGALAFHFIFGLLFAAVSASLALHTQIKQQTAATVLSKPISRTVFFLSTFFGVAFCVILFSVMSFFGSLLSIRLGLLRWYIDWWGLGLFIGAVFCSFVFAGILNYFRNYSFVSVSFLFLAVNVIIAFFICGFIGLDGSIIPFGKWVDWNIFPCSVLITIALLVLSGIALSFSTRLSPKFTLLFTVLVFFVGLISDYLFGAPPFNSVFSFLGAAAFPHWQDFWIADMITTNIAIPISYILMCALYGLLYLTSALCAGLIAFKYVDL